MAKQLTITQVRDKVAQIQGQVNGGSTLAEAINNMKISDATYRNWLNRLKGTKANTVANTGAGGGQNFQLILAENFRLKRIVAELAPDQLTVMDHDCLTIAGKTAQHTAPRGGKEKRTRHVPAFAGAG
jgi:hypothetical protein